MAIPCLLACAIGIIAGVTLSVSWLNAVSAIFSLVVAFVIIPQLRQYLVFGFFFSVEAFIGWLLFGGAFLNWFSLHTYGCANNITVFCPPDLSVVSFLGTWFSLGVFAALVRSCRCQLTCCVSYCLCVVSGTMASERAEKISPCL